jgi:hypothetical protein
MPGTDGVALLGTCAPRPDELGIFECGSVFRFEDRDPGRRRGMTTPENDSSGSEPDLPPGLSPINGDPSKVGLSDALNQGEQDADEATDGAAGVDLH